MTRMVKVKRAIDTPPKQFPTVIKPHAYESSPWATCLDCGQPKANRLHIARHYFEVNLSSKMKNCMCGYSELHFIHKRTMEGD